MFFDATINPVSFELGKTCPCCLGVWKIIQRTPLDQQFTDFEDMGFFAAVYILSSAPRTVNCSRFPSKTSETDGNLLTLRILGNVQEECQVLHENVCS